MNTEQVKKLYEEYVINTYGERALFIVRGEGTRVWDAEGREYLDLLTGIAVNLLGHCHPRIVEAVCQQAKNLIHASNLYYMKPQIELAQRLSQLSFGGKVFFCNSGAEANEAAIKLARRYAQELRQEDRYKIIAMKNSFHGRTYAAMTATGQEKYHKGYAPLLPGFEYAQFNDIGSVEALMDDKVCAVIVEPIQGEGGDIVSTKEFLQGLRSLCDECGALLIFDEVQCGIARTGRMFAYEHYGVVPDILTLAKPIGGGLPLGVMIARADVAEAFTPGSHASTFGGNPVACAAGVALLDVIEEENLVERAEHLGGYLKNLLSDLASRNTFVKEVRGLGLMVGVEVEKNGKEVVALCQKKGVLLNCTANNFIRFLPPLIVSEEELEHGVRVLEEALVEAEG